MTPFTTEILTDLAALERERTGWDRLAQEASRPYCAPGWALPWWSLVRPAGSELCAVAVRDGSELVGLAPFHLNRDRMGITNWRLLGESESSYVEPLVKREVLEAVVVAAAAAMEGGGRHVDVLSLTAVPRTSPRPRLLRESWPGAPPRISVVKTMRAPYVDVPDGGYEEWLRSRSRNFRQQVGGRRREFLRRGGQFRRADSGKELTQALTEFERLHERRWEHRGGSRALTTSVMEMLRRASGELTTDRLQVWTSEVDGVAVGAALFVAAGAEMHYWLGGFDEEWARCSPSLLLLVEALHYAADAGYGRVSLGPGAQQYKYRLATGDEELDWIDLLPQGRRYPYVRLCQTPYRAYRLASNRTSPQTKQRIRSSAERLIGGPRRGESAVPTASKRSDEGERVGAARPSR